MIRLMNIAFFFKDLNQINKNGDSPLHVAVQNEAIDAIQQLIKR